jgi:Pyridine nucleotide-disulphide oxidoreductase/Pyridine nucleotide-disulphide oxidoreductase, dimerisation domain/Phage integrase family
LPTVDPELGALVHAELERNGVEVLTDTAVTAITRTYTGTPTVTASQDGQTILRTVDFVLVVVGVRPDTELAADGGAELGVKGAIVVDEAMRTNLPDIFAAGDCVHTHYRLLGITWLPLGTAAHKQGRVAGENAVGGHAHFAGSLGSQGVKVFDLVVARTGLREHEALAADRGWTPVSSQSSPDDHKAYYPGSTPINIRITCDQPSGRLLGAQLVGHRSAEIAKRVDTYATALFHEMTVEGLSELDLSYTPPVGSPWDATLDLSADAAVLRVRRAVTYRDGQFTVGPPKTAAGVRDVVVPPHIRPTLKAHLRNHVGRGADALLFADTNGTHLRADRYRVHWEKARAVIGKPNLSVHDLRHVGAVLAAQSGATTAELMHRLGHATPQMALKYQHVAKGRDAEIARRLSKLAAAK